MSDDIVTRLRRLNNSVQGDDLDWICTSEAADEIERLRRELQHSALQTNVMRNIALGPYGDAADVIERLEAENRELRKAVRSEF